MTSMTGNRRNVRWRRGRKSIITILRVLVSIALVLYLLHKAGVSNLGSTLRYLDWTWLAAGLGAGLLASASQITQWRALLGAVGLNVRWLRCARLEYAGNVFDALLPTSVGGDVMRVYSASGGRNGAASAATSVLLRRVCNLPGLVVVMGASVLATIPLAYSERIRPYAGVGAIIAASAFLIVQSPLIWQLLRLPLLRSPRIATKALEVRRAFERIRADHSLVVAAALRGLLFWLLVVVSQFCYMRAVSIHVPITYAAVVVTTVSAISLLPISLGGYGVREGAFGAFLAVGGLATSAQGVTVGLCVTAQTILLGILGVPTLIGLRGKRRKSSDHAQPDHITTQPLQGMAKSNGQAA